jgi:hypothetical protein
VTCAWELLPKRGFEQPGVLLVFCTLHGSFSIRRAAGQEEHTSESNRGRAATRTSTIGNVVDSQLHTIVGGDDENGRFAPASREGCDSDRRYSSDY